MRNLKKVLALALAVVMLVGMMVVGASAAGYADVAPTNDNATAIAVVSAIEALEGSNGNFRPDGRLIRADAAVIAARVALQRENANNLAAVTAAYSDVSAKAYYAGAIAWATNEGILAGQGDGKFNPNGSLTGYAFAKMMLGVLGYDAEIEGYQNDKDYLININYDAAKAGLLVGLEGLDLSAKMTRGQAAQMAFNAIQAQRVVEYENDFVIVDGVWTTVQKAVVPEKAVNNNSLLDDVYTKLNRIETISTPNSPAMVMWTHDDILAPLSVEVLVAPTTITAKTDLSKLDLATLPIRDEEGNVVATERLQAKVNGIPTGTDLTDADDITALCIPGNTVEIYVDAGKIVAVTVTSESLMTVTGEYDDATELYSFDLTTDAGAHDLSFSDVEFDDDEDADNWLYNALVELDLDLDLPSNKVLVSTYEGEIVAIENALTVVGTVTKYVEKPIGVVTVNGEEHTVGSEYVAGDAITVKKDQILYVDHAGNILTVKNVPTETPAPKAIYVTEKTTNYEWSDTANDGAGAVVFDGTYTVKGYDLNGEVVTAVVEGTINLNTLCTYADADEDKIPELVALPGIATGTLTGTDADYAYEEVIGKYDLTAPNGEFYASGVKFLFIYDTDTTDADDTHKLVEMAEGVQVVKEGNPYVLVMDENSLVTHVIIKGNNDNVELNDEIIFVDSATKYTVDFYSIAADGETVLSNFYAYIDGEQTVISVEKGKEDTLNIRFPGFYQFETDENGAITAKEEYQYQNYCTNAMGCVKYINDSYYLSYSYTNSEEETVNMLYKLDGAEVYCLDQETSIGSVTRLYNVSKSTDNYDSIKVTFSTYYENIEALYVTYVGEIVTED